MIELNKRQGKRRIVAIRGFDEELYKIAKMYASLEGRTVASIIEEALQRWVEERSDIEELRLWLRLEEAYRENLEALRKKLEEAPGEQGEGYALACNGKVVGVFSNYEDAAKEAQVKCIGYALIVRLPLVEEEVELGLPW